MVRRFLVAASLALTGLVAAPPSLADDPPALSVNDLTMTEPTPAQEHETAVFTVSLDRPATSEVTVYYQTPTSSVNDPTSGQLTFAPGETEKQVPVIVHYDWGSGDYQAVLRILSPTGATIAKDRGVVTLINIDKAGSFACGGMGARVIFYQVPNEGGYDDRIADTDKEHLGCRDVTVAADSFTTTTPSGRGVKPVTVTVTRSAITLDAAEPPVAGDVGPFVGDGATARSVPVDVRVSEPGGKSIEVEGLWSSVSSHCRSLGADPDLQTSGGATGYVVNGVRVRDLPDVLTLGTAAGLTFGEVQRGAGPDGGGVTRTSLRVTTGSGSVMIGQVYVRYSSHPCQT